MTYQRSKEAKRASDKRHYQNNREKILAQYKIYRDAHKEQAKEYSKKYRAEKKEELAEKKRKYYLEHADEIKKKVKAWSQANSERVKQNKIRYIQTHADEVKETYKKWRLANKDRRLVSNQNRRAKKKNSDGKITVQEWRDLCDKYGNTCLCCGRNDVELTQDHIIPLSKNGKHVISNIQPLCVSCNSKKHTDIVDYR